MLQRLVLGLRNGLVPLGVAPRDEGLPEIDAQPRILQMVQNLQNIDKLGFVKLL